MTGQDATDFVKANWPTAVVTLAFVLPPALIGLRWLYENRIQEAQAKVRIREQELEELKRASAAVDRKASVAAREIRFPKVNADSEADLIMRIRAAKRQIRIFGLTRNFYATDTMRDLIRNKSAEIPIKFFVMDPECESRRDRYRVEPMNAAFEDPNRYKRIIEPAFVELLRQTARSAPLSDKPGLSFYYFNFPCQFSIDQYDDVCRVSFYGLNKQGRDSPIWVYDKAGSGPSYEYEYFISQLDWVERLASGYNTPESREKKLLVRAFSDPNA